MTNPAKSAAPSRLRTSLAVSLLPIGGGVAILAAALAGAPAQAVPAFAEQTGQPCQACHVGGFGPQLTPFGRAFKLNGYTMRAAANLPISAMAVGSFTKTRVSQSAPPADGFQTNDNLAFDQGSLFLAGGIGSHFGGFAQFTYDGVGKAWSWDNLDLRAVNTGTIAGKDVVYGLSLNNSPGVQDVWNTLPAWGYPYTGSALAPSPTTSPLIGGGLAQSVVGVTAYAWIDSKFYIEGGGYRSPHAGTLSWLGADPLDPGNLRGIAPYGRIAFENQLAGGHVPARRIRAGGEAQSGARPFDRAGRPLHRHRRRQFVVAQFRFRYADGERALYARTPDARCNLRARDRR